MSEGNRRPRAEVQKLPYDAGSPDNLASWDEALARLREARTYWLATTRPDGRPHVMPVWAVWVDDALCFSTSADSRKARNLARDPRCVMTIEHGDVQLVVEGVASRITDDAVLHRFVEAYGPKYDFPLNVRDGAVFDSSGGVGGPAFALRPAAIIGQTEDGSFTPTRWRFD